MLKVIEINIVPFKRESARKKIEIGFETERIELDQFENRITFSSII